MYKRIVTATHATQRPSSTTEWLNIMWAALNEDPQRGVEDAFEDLARTEESLGEVVALGFCVRGTDRRFSQSTSAMVLYPLRDDRTSRPLPQSHVKYFRLRSPTIVSGPLHMHTPLHKQSVPDATGEGCPAYLLGLTYMVYRHCRMRDIDPYDIVICSRRLQRMMRVAVYIFHFDGERGGVRRIRTLKGESRLGLARDDGE
ncbi:hypothetical protein EDB84DRAFT_1474702 [Lactarius hengduanensis]|nr:hypothetical protein EDB84DRAFT_1474702 [Lactarius hengduanensis]